MSPRGWPAVLTDGDLELRPLQRADGPAWRTSRERSRHWLAPWDATVPPGADDTAEKGELTFMDNVVDSLTGTIKLKATFDNRGHRLWPGQFASVTVTLAEPEVLTVPAAAIQNSQNGQHVFVVTADKNAELRPVVVERTFDNVAVIAKGLNEGERVAIDGQLRLTNGTRVEIRSAEAQPKAGAPS